MYSAAFNRLTVMSTVASEMPIICSRSASENWHQKPLSNKRSATGVQTNDAGSAIIRDSHAAPSQCQLLLAMLYSGGLNVDSLGSSCLSGV